MNIAFPILPSESMIIIDNAFPLLRGEELIESSDIALRHTDKYSCFLNIFVRKYNESTVPIFSQDTDSF